MKFIDLPLKRISSVYPLQVCFGQKKKKRFHLGLKSITFRIRPIQILYISFYTFIIINNTFWQMDHPACHYHIFAQKGYMSSKIPNSALHVFSN